MFARATFLSLLMILAASAEPGARLFNDLRARPADQAFYIAGKHAGIALVEKDFFKASRIWHVYLRAFPRSKYAAPAALQAALITRLGAGGSSKSSYLLRRAADLRGSQPLLKGCRQIAWRWLVIDQIRDLEEKIEKFYWSNVRYPKSLDELVSSGVAKSADIVAPGGKRFRYRLVPNELFPNEPAQEYHLSARDIQSKDRSGSEILAEWFTELSRYVFLGMGKGGDGRPMALLATYTKDFKPGRKMSLKLGDAVDGKHLIEVSPFGAILATPDYLLVFPQQTAQAAEAR